MLRQAVDSLVSSIQSVYKDIYAVAVYDESSCRIVLVGPFEFVTIVEKFVQGRARELLGLVRRGKQEEEGSRGPGRTGAGVRDGEDDEIRYEWVGRRRNPVLVRIYTADIARLEVDVIVNAANSRLENWAGVAGDIEAAGGQQLRNDCRELIVRGGPLKV